MRLARTRAPEGAHHAGTLAGLMFTAAAAVTALGLVLPHQPQVNEAGLTLVAAAAAGAAAVMLVARDRLPVWAHHVVIALGTALISLSLVFNGEGEGGAAGGDEVYYLWIVLHAAYFFGRAVVAGHALLILGAYALALAEIDPGPVAVSRWLTMAGLVCGTAVVVRALSERVAALIAELHTASRTDGLTGLANRRGLNERADVELARARRGGGPCSLLVLDLDRFKEINDRWGHAAGDAALAEVGAAILESVRRVDVPARIGGDEFAILLPDGGSPAASEVLARIRERVSVRARALSLPIELSGGIATLDAGSATLDDLARVADMALYAAKPARRAHTQRPVALREQGPVPAGAETGHTALTT